jgi:cell wall-associated NlpC family hydrolase
VVTRDQIVAEAMTWLGTPFVWGQCAKGRGCDCKGLIYGVARDLGMPEANGPLARFKSYRSANSALLLEGLQASLIPTEDPQAGDVACLIIGSPPKPQHLAMLVHDRRILHCYGRNLDRVVMVPLGKSRPIHSWWTWPSLGGAA